MNRESKLVNTHHPPEQEKVRTSLKSLTEESMIDVKLIIVHFCIWHLTLSHDFFFFSLKDYFDQIWVQLPVIFAFFFLCRDENTLFFKLCFSPQSDGEDDKEQPGWGQARSSEDFSRANSSLICATVCEFSRAFRQAPTYSYPLCTLPAQMPSAPSLQTRISPLVRNQ